MSTSDRKDIVSQAVITARLEAITEAHASNLIEGLDMGVEVLAAKLARARQPISNELFVRQEMQIITRELDVV